MLRGVRLGLDVGTVRIGVATCDPDGLLAVPLETIESGELAIARTLELIRTQQAVVVYIGCPVNLKGQDTQSTMASNEFAQGLMNAISRADHFSNVSVRMIDERLSTVSAQRGLHDAGRSVKTSRKVIDQAAAVVILEHALESEKRQGKLVGKEVTVVSE